MKSSEQTNEISAALAKAQGSINNPGKKAENPHFRSQYADLSSGINAIRDGLSINGIAVVQAPRVEGDILMLDTRLAHSSGQWIECEYPVCKFPAQPQVMGSSMTYARRYSLFSIVGIAGEDDDGNDANKAEVPAPPPRKITETEVQVIETALQLLPDAVRTIVLKRAKVGNVADISSSTFSKVVDFLNGELEKFHKDNLVAQHKAEE